jgi:hypothetical protein
MQHYVTLPPTCVPSMYKYVNTIYSYAEKDTSTNPDHNGIHKGGPAAEGGRPTLVEAAEGSRCMT